MDVLRRRAAQSHPVIIVVSPLTALDQIKARNIRKSLDKTYSFLEVKLLQSLKKNWTKINMIFVIKKQHTAVLANSNKITGARRHNIECK